MYWCGVGEKSATFAASTDVIPTEVGWTGHIHSSSIRRCSRNGCRNSNVRLNIAQNAPKHAISRGKIIFFLGRATVASPYSTSIGRGCSYTPHCPPSRGFWLLDSCPPHFWDVVTSLSVVDKPHCFLLLLLNDNDDYSSNDDVACS